MHPAQKIDGCASCFSPCGCEPASPQSIVPYKIVSQATTYAPTFQAAIIAVSAQGQECDEVVRAAWIWIKLVMASIRSDCGKTDTCHHHSFLPPEADQNDGRETLRLKSRTRSLVLRIYSLTCVLLAFFGCFCLTE